MQAEDRSGEAEFVLGWPAFGEGASAEVDPVLGSQVPEIGALELLASVGRLGSLGRAARRHGVSQPAAGSRIRRLEIQLGLPLIERSAGGSRLTPEGALVTDWARPVLLAAASLEAGVNALRRQQEGRVRVAASLTVAEYLMPGWLATLRQRYPQTKVALSVLNSVQVARLVVGEAVDIGFVEGPSVPDGLHCRVIAEDRLLPVVCPGHRWSRRSGALTAAELAVTPLICREAGSGTRQTLEIGLALQGPLAPPLLEMSSTTAIKSAVMEGVGPAVLSSLAVAPELAAGRLVAVEVEGLELCRQLRAIWPCGRMLMASVDGLLDVASSATRRRHGRSPALDRGRYRADAELLGRRA